MNSDLVRQVWIRAGYRCEYCHLPAAGYPLPFHVDHIIARQHGGLTHADNLALACLHCNRHKGPNIAGVDPVTGSAARLFDPRKNDWNAHFVWHGPELRGGTRVGRVTIHVLAVNGPEVLTVRAELMREGVFHLP